MRNNVAKSVSMCAFCVLCKFCDDEIFVIYRIIGLSDNWKFLGSLLHICMLHEFLLLLIYLRYYLIIHISDPEC